MGIGPEETLRDLAGRLGVLLWDGTPEIPGQTFVTVVAGSGGRIRGRLIGIESWSTRDLVGTIVDAR